MNYPKSALIYKICTTPEWSEARTEGAFQGAKVDMDDGFIHFSAAHQLRETASRHFAGISGLVLVEVACDRLGKNLKWEASRGADLFPHLYAALPLEAVTREWPLPLAMDGNHQFPVELEQSRA